MIKKGKREVLSPTKSTAKNAKEETEKDASKKQQRPLQRLFAKQQPKLRITDRTSKLLKLYADDNNIYIAELIQKWLSEHNKQL